MSRSSMIVKCPRRILFVMARCPADVVFHEGRPHQCVGPCPVPVRTMDVDIMTCCNAAREAALFRCRVVDGCWCPNGGVVTELCLLHNQTKHDSCHHYDQRS